MGSKRRKIFRQYAVSYAKPAYGMDYKATFTSYANCSCGAITLYAKNGKEYSFLPKNRRFFFPGLDLRKIPRLNTFYGCNHCVNHFGLDLCACGSGMAPDECDFGDEVCGRPYQSI